MFVQLSDPVLTLNWVFRAKRNWKPGFSLNVTFGLIAITTVKRYNIPKFMN